MGSNSFRNRKPFERASMCNHSQIITHECVQNILNNCILPEDDLANIKCPQGFNVDSQERNKIKHILSIDGGYAETFIKSGFPSASIVFFNFGALLFELADLENLETSVIINPEDLKKLKEIGKIPLALPSQNILIKGSEDFTHGVRKIVFDFFCNKENSALKGESFIEALQWLIFEGWDTKKGSIKLDFCPYQGCEGDKIMFSNSNQKIAECPKCHKEVYLTDYFRFHEVINEPNGARGMFGYLSSLIEQLILVQVIKYIYTNNKQMLAKIVFIKDGPLAFFGQTFRLYEPMRKLMKHLFIAGDAGKSIINLVGIEKSGPFVEHAFFIQEKLEKNHYYILDTEYIGKYIAPSSQDPYGENTYYGSKVIYKTEEGDILVLSIPVNEYLSKPQRENFSNIDVVLSVLSKLKCNMYENSVVPIALINKLVSISEFPSSKILEKFVKKSIN